MKLLEDEYKFHFDFIVIICPTLKWNQTYKSAKQFWNDPHVFLIEPNNNLFDWIKKLDILFAGYKTLFLLDNIIADNSLNQIRNPLIDLAISGRHKNHSLWFLTQSYTAIPRNIRRQAKMLYVWYPKDRNDLKTKERRNNQKGS